MKIWLRNIASLMYLRTRHRMQSADHHKLQKGYSVKQIINFITLENIP